MGYTLHRTTSPYLQKVRTHTEPYSVKVLGKELIVFPKVMSPKYDWSGSFHARKLGKVAGKDFLELGCGSGIVSLFAALKGAKKVVAVDINKDAVANTTANFKKYKLRTAKAFHSNLFSKVAGKFDVIVFNLPYHGNKPKDLLERGVADEGYKTMRRFLKQAGRFLKIGGEMHVGFSTSGDTKLLMRTIKENGFQVKKLHSEFRQGYNCQIYVIEKTESIS